MTVVERLAAPLARYRQYISADLEPEYRDEEMIVIGVNTARSLVFPFGEGRISERAGRSRSSSGSRMFRRRSCASSSRIIRSICRPAFTSGGWSAEARMAMARLAAVNADLFLSGHLHISHVSHVADRYSAGGHTGLIVQAGTVSTRGRGEQPSFNVLRMQRPEIELSRHSWDDATAGFTSSPIGHYRHSSSGWCAAPTTSFDRCGHRP